MDEPITSTAYVQLNIPRQQILCAAQDILYQFGPVVEEAVQEARHSLFEEGELQDNIKTLVKEKIKEIIKEGINRAASTVVEDVFWDKSLDLQKLVKDEVLKQLGKDVKL